MKILGIDLKTTRPKNIATPPPVTQVGRYSVVKLSKRILPADLDEYKNALEAGRSNYSQQRGKIYDYYQLALDFDAALQGAIDLRIISTVGRKLVYLDKDGQPMPLFADWLAAPEFRQFLTDLILSVRFWGMGLYEFGVINKGGRRWFNYSSVPIKHIDPYAKLVRKYEYQTSPDDASYDDLPNVRFVGNSDLGGALLTLSYISLLKRAAINDWANYCQLAGNNFMVLDYRGELPDPAQRADAMTNLLFYGRGAIDKIPGVDVETRNLSSSSQNQLFEGYVGYLDELTTRTVLGQTMTTVDGSSRSQAEVHERTQATILDADAQFVIDYLNYELHDLLPLWDLPQGGRFAFAESATLKKMQQLEFDLKLQQLGYIWTREELQKRYNLL